MSPEARTLVRRAAIGLVAIAALTFSGVTLLDARGAERHQERGLALLRFSESARASLDEADVARASNDAAKRALALYDFDAWWEGLGAEASMAGGEIARAADDARRALGEWRTASRPEESERAIAEARADFHRISTLATASIGADRSTVQRGLVLSLVAFLAAVAGLVLSLRKKTSTEVAAAAPDEASVRTELARLERDRRMLRRRIELVSVTSDENGAYGLGQRIVSAIADETSAPVVLLHIAPVSEPMALEVVAAVGISSIGAQSPEAVLEVMRSKLGVALAIPDRLDELAVFTSTATIRPRTILLRPLMSGERCCGVAEIGLTRDLDSEELQSLDDLLAAIAPTISHMLANEYAHKLSTAVRAQAATVADVHAELDTVFEALADGLAITDEEGNIVRINAAGREILDLAASESDARATLADLSNPLFQALREGTRTAGVEVAVVNATSRRIVQIKVSPLSERASSRAAVAVFRDVTRERQLEHELRKQSKTLAVHVTELETKQHELERATQLKSEFLANMSHELRTPLNAVIGFTEILLDGTYGALNPKQGECAGDVLAGGRHLLGLINDVLDLSKIEAGKMELAREDLELSEVVGQAMTLVRPQASAKGIRLELDVEAGAWVNADPDRLRQVLVNLLSNAVKFTPNGGRVAIEARVVDGFARVAVIDTGIGIAKEHADKLFREFSQVDGSITRRFGGTGLGLAISKRLVELHGGVIGFDSEPGKGSTFHFTVRRVARTERPAFTAAQMLRRSSSRLPASTARSFGRRRSVLVVDADAAAGKLITSALHEAGLIPLFESTLADARAIAEVQSIDALVIDPSLDDGSVEEAMAFAAARFGTSVVLTSNLAEDELSLSQSTVAFLRKPLDRASLVDKVRSAIARNRGPRRALVVDAHDVDGPAVKLLLERESFAVDLVTSLAAARAELATAGAARCLVVVELDLPDGDGKELVTELAANASVATVVLTSRELPDDERGELERQASCVIRKGTLSRSAFARHVASALRDLGPSRRRVLAVDDNEQNLRLISAVLGKRGFEILQARDATSAVAIARAERPDVILMDVMLPDVDGLSATRELKADTLTRSIPIIAVTANAMPGDATKAAAAGCCDYVTKPIDSARLVRAVEAALSPKAAACA